MIEIPIFLIDCYVSGVDKSILILLETDLNTVALKQSEPLGHGHYLFSLHILSSNFLMGWTMEASNMLTISVL